MSLSVDMIALHSAENLSNGVSDERIRTAEMELGIRFPDEYREYLLRFNYGEIFGDPLYGCHDDEGLSWCDVVSQNRNTDHLSNGFLAFISTDIDGTLYFSLSGLGIYNDMLDQPVANSFAALVEGMLAA